MNKLKIKTLQILILVQYSNHLGTVSILIQHYETDHLGEVNRIE